MLQKLLNVTSKPERIGLGIMSGTSVDGVDVAIISVKGSGEELSYQQLAFDTVDIPQALRREIFKQFSPAESSVDKLCSLNFKLGELFSTAARSVVEKAGLSLKDIDFIGSHGQTIYHIPVDQKEEGLVKSTLQIGEASVLAEKFQCPVISDFRVRDMAAGGEGAPLVPYVDYLLFRSETENIALQNIGGIGNVTYLSKGGSASDVIAFDTGPGNMIMDEAVRILTHGKFLFDKNGELAARGKVNEEFLNELMAHPYFTLPVPKSTGREMFGATFTRKLVDRMLEKGLSSADILATVTMFTAMTIVNQLDRFLPSGGGVDTLVVSGGGAYNATLLGYLKVLGSFAVKTQEDLGFSSDSKEAVAFALLANETLFGVPNNVPSATGAAKQVVLGKLTI
ncbi:anhydro-N-acetylmuramic acid kinase [Sutcliffiella horikoshii]|uniref:Anhydro-N-acetylmuramic acid kinase n=1 Tax=Sutcliffiella horikoshii TaxID=79883 RepID=A0ABN4ZDP0_9BACI|nr:anhydro-N-acetylmuramic acid kinase [Sutcliffiella horikoshii]ART75328.1 anhydro-N-acetylmuramic acid kinase [Sutcliffiella horikoshii]